jgi:hypothetical protein
MKRKKEKERERKEGERKIKNDKESWSLIRVANQFKW